MFLQYMHPILLFAFQTVNKYALQAEVPLLIKTLCRS
jgi:hypothetical protein